MYLKVSEANMIYWAVGKVIKHFCTENRKTYHDFSTTQYIPLSPRKNFRGNAIHLSLQFNSDTTIFYKWKQELRCHFRDIIIKTDDMNLKF